MVTIPCQYEFHSPLTGTTEAFALVPETRTRRDTLARAPSKRAARGSSSDDPSSNISSGPGASRRTAILSAMRTFHRDRAHLRLVVGPPRPSIDERFVSCVPWSRGKCKGLEEDNARLKLFASRVRLM